MVKIQKLSPETTGKIAAGEVVERPFNVVKELIENSLDAAATRIVLEIDGGGKRTIRIDDNGTGISVEDMTKAVENFSTSKIREIEDIYRVRSLGFRGEALASINSSIENDHSVDGRRGGSRTGDTLGGRRDPK